MVQDEGVESVEWKWGDCCQLPAQKPPLSSWVGRPLPTLGILVLCPVVGFR